MGYKYTCAFCGKEVVKDRKVKGNTYCDYKCMGSSKKRRVIVPCAECGKDIEYRPSEVESRTNYFCCKLCKEKWESVNFKGENNPNWKGGAIEKTCLNCENKYSIEKHRADKSSYCSVKCKNEHLKNVISQTDEWKAFHREIGLRTIHNQNRKQKNKDTLPEIITKQYLENNNIEYIAQHKLLNRYLVDFYLPKYNIVIEVFGDYWHCNPKIYGNKEGLKPISEKQKIKIEKDKIRLKTLRENNYITYVFWEQDIHKDINLLFEPINQIINSEFVTTTLYNGDTIHTPTLSTPN